MKDLLKEQKQRLLLCLGSVFFWGLLAHAYGFLRCNLSHDALNAFVATPREEIWKVELGRFLVPVYRAVFRGPVTLPWLTGLLGLLWTAAALVLLTGIFRMESRVLVFLTAGILTTNITCIAQVATYLYEYDCNALALLLSVAAVYLWYRGGVVRFLAGSLCLTASMGLYQAYFAVAVTLMVWKSVMDLLDENDVRQVVLRGLKGIGLLLVGGILYLLATKLVSAATGTQLQDRVNALNGSGGNPVLFYLGLVMPAMKHLLTKLLHPAYQPPLAVFAAIVTVASVAAAIRVFWVKRYRFGRITLILLLVALTPFAMTCVYFLAKGKDAHDLTVYALWFFYVFVLLFAFRLCGKDLLPGRMSRGLRAAACILVAVLLWQNVVLANTAYVKKEKEAEADLSMMTRVVCMLEDREDFVPGQTPVTFIGVPKGRPGLYGMDRVGAIIGLGGHSVFSTDTSQPYYNAYRAYFDYVLRYPMAFCTDVIHYRLKEDPRVQALPAYPQEGYIAMIDGVLVIKMG